MHNSGASWRDRERATTRADEWIRRKRLAGQLCREVRLNGGMCRIRPDRYENSLFGGLVIVAGAECSVRPQAWGCNEPRHVLTKGLDRAVRVRRGGIDDLIGDVERLDRGPAAWRCAHEVVTAFAEPLSQRDRA